MENIEANLKRYRHLVVSHLKATDISLKLPTGIITIEERTELNRLAATSQALATEHILDILDKSEEPGKWQAFSEALQSADYPYLLEILKSTPKMGKHEDYYLKLIHVFANELQQRVVPMHILPYLLSKGVINEGDVQEITARQLNFGPQLASLLLLDLLPRRQRPEIWYGHFLQGLLEDGHKDLVEQIDPDYISTQKLEPITEGKVKQGYTSSGASWDGCHSDTEEMECVMEDAVEPEYDSMGDQGAPSLSNPESCDMFDIKDQSEEICDIESSPVVSSSSSLTSSKIQASFFTPMKLAHSHDFRIPKNDSEEIDTTNKLDDQIKVDITSTNKLDTQPQRDKQMVYKPNVSVEDNCDESEDENFMTSDYDDEEDNEPPTKKMMRQDPLLQLRNYQIELAKIAVGGENTIICAPTGSGKTWVALHIIKKHLETRRPKEKKTVAFMAKTNPLIKQQYKRCIKYLPQYRTSLVTGDTEESTHLDAFLPVSDILCFTPQILVNNLESKSVKSLSEFTLLIVDECHHTKKEDAYNKLMRKYLTDLERKNINNLPQVVGLTASVGAGKSSTVDEAVNYILGIMANMDVYKLSTVQKYREELEKHVSVPKEVIIPMVTGVNRESQGMIEDIMMKIEEELQDPCLFEPDLNLLLSSEKPSDYKAQNYMQWVRTLEKTTSTVVTDPNTARHILACARYLVILSAALEMNSLLTVQDVMMFLSTSLKPISQHQEKQTKEEKILFQLQKGLLQDLKRCLRNNAHNPNLVKMRDTLEEMLLAEIMERKSPRALVFVKTRATCLALAKFLDKEMGKKGIKVYYLTGKSAKEGDDGMTEAEQTDALNKFEQGHYLVLVSTSVGSEGIDIPDCNIVLSYNYAGNEITKIQMTGRGRQKNSTKIALASETVIKQETVSAYRADMMYKAIDKLKSISESEICGKIRQIQREQLIKQEIREKNAHKKEGMKKEGNFRLQCIICSVDVVSNDYIKCVKNSHHIVIDKNFLDKIQVKMHPKPKKIEGMEVKKMIFCKNCGHEWGIYFEYCTVELPIIQIRSFKVINNDDGDVVTPKKWKDVPFQIANCEFSEVLTLYQD